ncbi:hypothetical protein [Streptomyces sp. GZWMJZ-114]|uniref:hypothetical protein n=1 Tax=Streptomyces sp. GZWMJZ-114 TaxID=2494734 RepID=UPI0013E9677A|nr:hypothetical protein [Streptomyces sp. GZWMJZ-114]
MPADPEEGTDLPQRMKTAWQKIAPWIYGAIALTVVCTVRPVPWDIVLALFQHTYQR